MTTKLFVIGVDIGFRNLALVRLCVEGAIKKTVQEAYLVDLKTLDVAMAASRFVLWAQTVPEFFEDVHKVFLESQRSEATRNYGFFRFLQGYFAGRGIVATAHRADHKFLRAEIPRVEWNTYRKRKRKNQELVLQACQAMHDPASSILADSFDLCDAYGIIDGLAMHVPKHRCARRWIIKQHYQNLDLNTVDSDSSD